MTRSQNGHSICAKSLAPERRTDRQSGCTGMQVDRDPALALYRTEARFTKIASEILSGGLFLLIGQPIDIPAPFIELHIPASKTSAEPPLVKISPATFPYQSAESNFKPSAPGEFFMPCIDSEVVSMLKKSPVDRLRANGLLPYFHSKQIHLRLGFISL